MFHIFIKLTEICVNLISNVRLSFLFFLPIKSNQLKWVRELKSNSNLKTFVRKVKFIYNLVETFNFDRTECYSILFT